MTDEPGTDVALPEEDLIGLEDFDVTDHVMPRLQIVHPDGVFKDGLSGELYEQLDCIVLGLVKQRVMWEPEIGEGVASPLCKSFDHKSGYANPKSFPWKASTFDPANYDEDRPVLECADCPLKEWGSNPVADTPWCTEQYTLIIMQPIGEGYAPALLSLQRSGIKPVRAYLSSFSRSRTPLFTVATTISLSTNKRGNVTFSVPGFVKGGSSDEALWKNFGNQYREIRKFITTPSSAPDPGGEAATSTVTEEGATPAPVEEDVPLAEDDDEVPF